MITCDQCGSVMREEGTQPLLACCWACLELDQVIKRETISLEDFRNRRRKPVDTRLLESDLIGGRY